MVKLSRTMQFEEVDTKVKKLMHSLSPSMQLHLYDF